MIGPWFTFSKFDTTIPLTMQRLNKKKTSSAPLQTATEVTQNNRNSTSINEPAKMYREFFLEAKKQYECLSNIGTDLSILSNLKAIGRCYRDSYTRIIEDLTISPKRLLDQTDIIGNIFAFLDDPSSVVGEWVQNPSTFWKKRSDNENYARLSPEWKDVVFKNAKTLVLNDSEERPDLTLWKNQIFPKVTQLWIPNASICTHLKQNNVKFGSLVYTFIDRPFTYTKLPKSKNASIELGYLLEQGADDLNMYVLCHSLHEIENLFGACRYDDRFNFPLEYMNIELLVGHFLSLLRRTVRWVEDSEKWKLFYERNVINRRFKYPSQREKRQHSTFSFGSTDSNKKPKWNELDE